MKPLRAAFEIFTVSAMALAVLWISTEGRDAVREAEAYSHIRPYAERAITHDRLVGKQLFFPSFRRHSGEGVDLNTAGTSKIVWLIDLDRCVGCLNDVVLWNRLATEVGLDAHLILLGEAVHSPDWEATFLRNTTVWTSDLLHAERVLGGILPSTKLWLDKDNVVLMVDSRFSGQSCGWSFEGQMGAVLKEFPSSWIRR